MIEWKSEINFSRPQMHTLPPTLSAIQRKAGTGAAGKVWHIIRVVIRLGAFYSSSIDTSTPGAGNCECISEGCF